MFAPIQRQCRVGRPMDGTTLMAYAWHERCELTSRMFYTSLKPTYNYYWDAFVQPWEAYHLPVCSRLVTRQRKVLNGSTVHKVLGIYFKIHKILDPSLAQRSP